MSTHGTLDVCKDGWVAGWAAALPPNDQDPVEIEIDVDGVLWERRRADIFRSELLAAGIGSGRHGFSLNLPRRFCDQKEHVVEVRCDGKPLNGSPASFVWSPKFTAKTFNLNGPWIDRDDGLDRLRGPAPQGRERVWPALRELAENGATVLRNAAPHDVIDALLRDVERIWQERPKLKVTAHGMGTVNLDEIAERSAIPDGRYRLMDMHNVSEAGAELATLPAVVELMQALFESTPVAMQSLFFEYGTQQRAHQDFAFVHNAHPAMLSAAWVACEDVLPDAGPLFYYIGSHRKVPKYDFGGGDILSYGDATLERAFERYLAEECDRLGLRKVEFCPRKGDVLIWHSALVHGGSGRRDPTLTRKSFVTHYSSREQYAEDRRSPGKTPDVRWRHGAMYYAWQEKGHHEAAYALHPRSPS